MWWRLKASTKRSTDRTDVLFFLFCFCLLNFSMFCGYSFKGRRITATKIVLLVTDGQSNFQTQLTIPRAKVLKHTGVKIFVVAVGIYISGIDEMVKVASYPPERFLFRVKTLQQFWEVMKLVISEVAPGQYTTLLGQDNSPC